MRTIAKAQMFPRLPRDVEALPLGKVNRISIGRRNAQLHYLPFSYGVPPELKIRGGNARNQSDRRLIPERFLNDTMEECWVRLHVGELLRVREQEIDSIA